MDNDCSSNYFVDFLVSNDLRASDARYADFFYLHHCRTSVDEVSQVVESVQNSALFARHGGRNFFTFTPVFPKQESEIRLYPVQARPDFVLYHMRELLETDMGQWRANNPPSEVSVSIDSFRFRVSDPSPTLADLAARFNIPVEVVHTVDSLNIVEWGHADIHLLFETLARLINCETSGNSTTLLVDAGANVGRISKSMMQIFPDCTEIVAVEPLDSNVELLKKMASETATNGRKFHVVQGGLSETSGNLTFEHKCGKIDDIARIVYPDGEIAHSGISAYGNMQIGDCQSSISVHSVADLMHAVMGGDNWSEIFLLKLDLEGHDAEVIKGAISDSLFARRKIKFVSFEFTIPWLSDKRSLEYVIRKLWSVGYFCFWITKDNLVPVSAWFFHRALELRRWTNFFCGHHLDDDLNKILLDFNQDPSHFVLYRAFAHTLTADYQL